jgi:hypothetical protein
MPSATNYFSIREKLVIKKRPLPFQTTTAADEVLPVLPPGVNVIKLSFFVTDTVGN